MILLAKDLLGESYIQLHVTVYRVLVCLMMLSLVVAVTPMIYHGLIEISKKELTQTYLHFDFPAYPQEKKPARMCWRQDGSHVDRFRSSCGVRQLAIT